MKNKKSKYVQLIELYNSGKTNVLEGIKLAFSCITNDYYKISVSDFFNSDDSKSIEISVELEEDSIPSLNFVNENGKIECGFKVIIRKSQRGRYVKEIYLLNGSNIDYDILREDEKIPNLYLIPLIRIEDIYTSGLTTGISKFINSEEKYKELIKDSKNAIEQELKYKKEKFQDLCKKFNENLDIELTDPKFSNEKVYIVDGKNEHNFNIGSGYKSIANIMLNTLDENFNIILIDEIEKMEKANGTDAFNQQAYDSMLSWLDIFKQYVPEYKKAMEKVQQEAGEYTNKLNFIDGTTYEVKNNEQLETSIVPIGDGITISVKKR